MSFNEVLLTTVDSVITNVAKRIRVSLEDIDDEKEKRSLKVESFKLEYAYLDETQLMSSFLKVHSIDCTHCLFYSKFPQVQGSCRLPYP